MNPNYPKVAGRALHRCEYCYAPEAVFNFPFEVEHIVPRSLGGEDSFMNLALACRSCNLYKGNRLQHLDEQSNVFVAVFNPRFDAWKEHFVVDTESATIVGITSTGRATIACLRMNSEPQRLARQQWIKLGVFP